MLTFLFGVGAGCPVDTIYIYMIYVCFLGLNRFAEQVILKLNGESTQNWRLDAAVHDVQGLPWQSGKT